MAALNPYLNFAGNTEEAFDFYKSVFGGQFQSIMRFKDVPSEYRMPEDENEKIMHVSLPIGEGSLLMGSDRPSSMGQPTAGDNFYIAINTDSQEEATRLFNRLSEGGHVAMPLENAFWGSYFGMFTDRFGVQWMVSYAYSQPK